MAASSTLIGFAVLRANYDANAPSYFDNFQPFALAILAATHPKPTQRRDVAPSIRLQFGIRIPDLAVKSLLRRTSRAKLTVANGTDFISLTPEGLAKSPEIDQQIIVFRRRQEELVTHFRVFLKERFSGQPDLDTADLGERLSAYLESHAVPLLNQSIRGQTASEKGSSEFDYAVSAYIAHLSTHDQARFSYVEEAAKGAILASVLTLEKSADKKPLDNLRVVLDTPVLMNLLGFHGAELESPALDLLAMAQKQGATVIAFQHSLRELDGILDGVERSLRSARASKSLRPSYLHFTDIGASASDVAVARDAAESKILDLGIEIADKPEYDSRHTLDESKLEELLQEKVRYKEDATRIFDVDSLSAVYRMRRGVSSAKLEATRAILVTSNSNLVIAANGFERTQDAYSLAIRDDSLAGILWVRDSAADANVPRQLLLAAAYSGMQPSPSLWARYLAEVDNLEKRDAVTPDEAIILRSTSFSRDAVMEETMGDPDQITEESPLKVLEKLRSERSDEIEVQLRALASASESASQSADRAAEAWLARTDELEQLRKAKTELSDLLEAAKIDVARSNDLRAEADRKVEATAAEDAARDKRLLARAGRRADIQVAVSLVALAVFLAAASVLALSELPASWQWIGFIAGVSAVVLPILQFFFPGTVLEWLGPVRRRLATRKLRKYRRALGLEQ